MKKRPSKANLIGFCICAASIAGLSAAVSNTVELGLKSILAFPVGALVFLANNDFLLIAVGSVVWALAAISTVMSGYRPWRIASWVLISCILLGTAFSFLASTVFTVRGGM